MLIGRDSSARLVRRAVVAGVRAEHHVLDAVAKARSAGVSYLKVGALLGTSAQAAPQRCGTVLASS